MVSGVLSFAVGTGLIFACTLTEVYLFCNTRAGGDSCFPYSCAWARCGIAT